MKARPAPLSLTPRQALVGLAWVSLIVAAFAVVRAAENVWAADIERNLAAAEALLEGAFGTVEDYLYSPLAAGLTVPALAVPPGVAVVGWLGLKVAVLLVGVALATRDLKTPDRVMAAVVALTFLPIVYDLELGNVTVLVLAAVAVAAWTPDRVIAGIPLGLILATVPKPQLIPVLIWLMVFRRRTFGGAIGSAAAASVAGLALFGPAAYQEWLEALRAPRYLGGEEVINLALWSLPLPIAVLAAAASIGAFLVALRRGYWPGLAAALCVGLLLAPYTLVYGAGVLLVVARPAAVAAPRAVLALALAAPVALVVAFPVWVGAALALSALVPTGAWPDRPRSSIHPAPSAAVGPSVSG